MKPHSHGGSAHGAGGLGALLGLGLVLGLTYTHPIAKRFEEELDLGTTFVALALESAPAILVAYVAAGLVHGLVPARVVAWLERGSAVGQAGRGVLLGPFLPLCSCGVLPVYRSLVARGTPLPSALALLVAAPEIGIAAMLLSVSLLGARLAVVRGLCAVLVALVVGVVAGRAASRGRAKGEGAPLPPAPTSGSFLGKLASGMRIALVDDVDHTAPWLLLGIGASAFLEPLVHVSSLSSLPRGVDVPLAALAGLPLYVCASGATPLVAVLLHKGLSPGAAVAFLLVGPATNVTTFGLLARLHGRRVALTYIGVMVALPVALGLAVNAALDVLPRVSLHDFAAHDHPWFEAASLAAVAALVVASLVRQGPRAFVRQIGGAHDHDTAKAGAAA